MKISKLLGVFVVTFGLPGVAHEVPVGADRPFEMLLRNGGLRERAELITPSLKTKLAETVLQENTSLMSPAPRLSLAHTYAVISTLHPQNWEIIQIGQLSTQYTHGGAEMYVVTLDGGYGNNPVCQINGIILTQYKIETVTNSSGVVLGFLHYYNACGFQGGTWTYQNTSSNSPWNTISDYCNIQ